MIANGRYNKYCKEPDILLHNLFTQIDNVYIIIIIIFVIYDRLCSTS